MIIKRFASVFKAGGFSGVLSAVVRRIRTPRARSFPKCAESVKDAIGIEIGGPSPIFARGGLIPLYPLAARIDNVNFADGTIWHDASKEGRSFTFHPGKAPGRLFVAEGSDLRLIPCGDYDFVLSSHMLEHTANPLRALAEWGRVLRPGGVLMLVVPHRDGTFDHLRPITTMSHLVNDFEANMDEKDLTHLPETLELHDLSRDPGVTDTAMFRARAEQNAEFRSLHHHVFDTRLVVDAVLRAAFELVAVETLRPYHVVVFARKPLEGAAPIPFAEGALRTVLSKSPFPSDRQGL